MKVVIVEHPLTGTAILTVSEGNSEVLCQSENTPPRQEKRYPLAGISLITSRTGVCA